MASVSMEAFRISGLDFPRATVVAVSLEVRIGLMATRALSHNFPDVRLEIPHQAPGDQGPACQSAS